MKKLIAIMLSLMSMMLFTACGVQEKKAKAPAEKTAAVSVQNKDTKTLVVYYSATGNTRRLAETMANALNADLFELQPEQPYTSHDLEYNDTSTRATVEQKDATARPKIANKVENMAKYDTVILAYPIWWGIAPRVMYTFMESYDFSGKTLTAVCTSGGSGLGSSDKELAALASSATWKEGRQFGSGASAEELQKWFKQLGML